MYDTTVIICLVQNSKKIHYFEISDTTFQQCDLCEWFKLKIGISVDTSKFLTHIRLSFTVIHH